MAAEVQYDKSTTRISTFLTPKDPDTISRDYVTITPQKELNFVSINNKYIAELRIVNLLKKPVLYKIRTTAAKHYLVHPSAGKILEKDEKIVNIIMPLKDEANLRYDDLFLVQAVPCINDNIEDNVKIVLRNFQNSDTSKDLFKNIKLKVHFELDNNPNSVEYRSSLQHYTPSKFQNEMLNERFGVNAASTAPSLKSQDNDHDPNQFFRKQVRFEEGGSRHSLDDEIEHQNFQQVSHEQNSIAEDVRSAVYQDFHGHELTNAFIASPDQSNNKSEVMGEEDSIDKGSLGGFSVSSKKGLILKKRCIELEKKYLQKKEILTKITADRDMMTQELYKLRFFSDSSCVPQCDKSTVHGKKIVLWQLMIISVVFLILGSLISR